MSSTQPSGVDRQPPRGHLLVLNRSFRRTLEAENKSPRTIEAYTERRTHDDTRHGTTTLFAALEVATGRVTDQCFDRHRHGEFLAFLQLVAKAYPRRQLHLVLDNYGTHTHAAVKAWLARHPRIHLHFTPTSASWMNLVEVFFSIITRQAIRRGSFPSVPDLIAAIGRFVDGWNERCQPFVWVKTPTTSLSRRPVNEPQVRSTSAAPR